MEFIIYTVFSAIYAFVAARKTDRAVLGFVLILWILAQPVISLQLDFIAHILPFNLSPNRMLFLFCIGYLILRAAPYHKTTNPHYKSPRYETYMYLFLIPVLIAHIVNIKLIPARSIISAPIEVISFITVYITMKRYMTRSLLDAILKAIILLSVFSAVLVIFQLIVNQDFLRTGEPKYAFGNIYRAFGIFRFDGELGFFQAFAFIVLLVRYPKGILKNLYIILILISIFLTFHRLGYLVIYACLVIYTIFYTLKASNLKTIFALVFVPLILATSYIGYTTFGGSSDFVETRLKSDTVTGRFLQYYVAAEATIRHPFGLAHYENPKYMPIMAKHGMVQSLRDERGMQYYKPLATHNGFLEVAIKYGIIGFIIFILLLVSLFRYFKLQAKKQSRQYIIPLFAVIIWFLSNLSQANSNLNIYYVLLLAIIIGSFQAMNRIGGRK